MPAAVRVGNRRPRWLKLGNWTLRTRLIASLLCLLVVVCLGVGIFTRIALRGYLNDQLDKQLTVSSAFGGFGGGGGGGDMNTSCTAQGTYNQSEPGRSGLTAPNGPRPQLGDSIFGRFSATNFNVCKRTYSSVNRILLTQADAKVLRTVPADGRPRTVDLPNEGRYRVVVKVDNRPDAAAGTFIVNGFATKGNDDTLTRLAWLITGLSAVALVIAGFLGALIIRLALRPLRRVTATASRVAEMPLNQGEVALAVRVPDPNPHTEVGQVGVALNHMLENVSDALNARHQSEMRVRQFVADASHELRTPLASIRGYAELTRRSRDEAPADIAYAMGRVESEADRMTALVEDLLLLARLDAGRPLAAEPVDLTMLALDVLSDAHAAGPEHKWSLSVPEEAVVVRGDEPRLHQVLANTLANARTHTPPGTDVLLTLAPQGNSVVIEVTDNGPGIAPDLLKNVFQRFSRGEEGRSRNVGSTGLGLAIVDAVVAAHHGHISVTSEPGRTVFRIVLPAHGMPLVASQTSARSGSDSERHEH